MLSCTTKHTDCLVRTDLVPECVSVDSRPRLQPGEQAGAQARRAGGLWPQDSGLSHGHSHMHSGKTYLCLFYKPEVPPNNPTSSKTFLTARSPQNYKISFKSHTKTNWLSFNGGDRPTGDRKGLLGSTLLTF